MAVIAGESGSGKTTLLFLLAGGDRPTRGAVHFGDLEMTSVSPGRLVQMRRAHMGFMFQDFRLIRRLTVLDNVRLPVLLGGEDSLADDAPRLIERVNMPHRLHQRPNELSRSEMQRVALPRALINRPEILFADEPTANLDRRNGEILLDLVRELHEADGLTVVIVTHHHDRAPGEARVLGVDDGRLVDGATS